MTEVESLEKSIALEKLYRHLAEDEVWLALKSADKILKSLNEDEKILGRPDRQQLIAVAGLVLQQITYHKQDND